MFEQRDDAPAQRRDTDEPLAQRHRQLVLAVVARADLARPVPARLVG
ncbi:MAG: hypothetical protein J2P36_13410 [Ktedonobacteraceae bacterium]|nr:hypothetical protein [Ktedonobacteraceae bacterium]